MRKASLFIYCFLLFLFSIILISNIPLNTVIKVISGVILFMEKCTIKKRKEFVEVRRIYNLDKKVNKRKR